MRVGDFEGWEGGDCDGDVGNGEDVGILRIVGILDSWAMVIGRLYEG